MIFLGLILDAHNALVDIFLTLLGSLFLLIFHTASFTEDSTCNAIMRKTLNTTRNETNIYCRENVKGRCHVFYLIPTLQ